MKTEEDVGEFYGKFYDRLVKFACNANRGGDGLQIDKEDAEDLVSDMMLGHLANPSEMSVKYIYNRIISRRIDWHRNNKRAVDSLSELKQQPPVADREREFDIDEKMISRLIREDIKEIEDEVVKEVVSRHIILGETIREAVRNVPYANQVMVYQFLEETKEKYSSILSEND